MPSAGGPLLQQTIQIGLGVASLEGQQAVASSITNTVGLRIATRATASN